jgi:hypothetical protein
MFSAGCGVLFAYAYALTAVEAALLRSAIHFFAGLLVMIAIWLQLRMRKRDWATLNTRLDVLGGTPPVIMTLDLQ